MSDMKVQASGGIAFHRSPQEREERRMRLQLKEDIKEIHQLKEELKEKLEELDKILSELKGG